MEEEKFDITGMSCAACSAHVHKAVSALKSETFGTLERSSIGLSRSRKNLCPVALSAYLLRPMEPSPWVLRAERWLTQ